MKNTETLFVRVPESLKAYCVTEADKNGISLNAFIIMLLLQNQEKSKTS